MKKSLATTKNGTVDALTGIRDFKTRPDRSAQGSRKLEYFILYEL